MQYDQIAKLASQVFKKSGTQIPVEVVKAAASYELEVFVTDMEKMVGATPSGILAKHQGKWAIYINNEDSLTRQRFTIAHELGHFLLHSGKQFVDSFSAGEAFYRDGEDSTQEREANYFAACLLMPSEEVEKLWPESKDPKDAARKFQVSEVSMTYRLKHLGLISIEE